MKKPNIVIIVLDTLRLDEFEKLEQKHGEFGKLGFSFLKNCIAPASWTLPSHASLLTGLYPKEHGAHETREAKTLDIERVKLRNRTMVSDLSEIGYRTYCISSNPYLHPIYGFDEFDSFKEESYFTDVFGHAIEIPERLRPRIAAFRERYGNDVAKIAGAIMREDPNLIFEAPAVVSATLQSTIKKLQAKLIDGWPIEKGGRLIVKTVKGTKFKGPYFLLINMMEAHDPYVGKKGQDFNWATPFLKRQPSAALLNKWKKLYDVASKRAYDYAAQVVNDLNDRYGDNQMFIVTSDHGQAFNEHGFIGHGTVTYDEVVKIPMAIRLQGGNAVVVRSDYSSWVNVKGFIFTAIASPGKASDRLYSKTVYSQSFGMPANISMVPGLDKAKLKSYDKPNFRTFRSR
jgi:arylsulfatase A-like enzyme